ncbi:MAG: dTMP kinase [Dehalococcoidales bacterium]|nr:dTMP kinase [Dehalococcoidales bacterium]
MKEKNGLFITFEGGEGSGKSLQTRKLYRRLQKLSLPVILIHEPGSTALGEKLSRLLKWGHSNEISPLAELLLFNAARAQLVQQVINPALSAGKIVICDRFADSTLAYQGCGRGLDMAAIKNANATATGGLQPEMTFLLDIPVKEGLARKSTRETNRFEKEEVAFHERVRQGYLQIAASEPRRFTVIDARLDKKRIAGIIWQRVSSILE